jgi:hypothetical protein
LPRHGVICGAGDLEIALVPAQPFNGVLAEPRDHLSVDECLKITDHGRIEGSLLTAHTMSSEPYEIYCEPPRT